MTSYPGAMPAFGGEIGGNTDPLSAPDLPAWAAHISAELVAMATELGTNPRGSAADVKARMVANEAAITALQAAIASIDEKPSVRLATAAALPANTQVGLTLVASANGALANIDGVAPALGDRILVKNQTTTSKHGIYTVTDLGSAGTPWVLTRAGDADVSAEVTAGLYVTVDEGSTQAGTGWLLTTANPIVLGTTALTFTQFPAATVAAAVTNLALPAGGLALVSGTATLGGNSNSFTTAWLLPHGAGNQTIAAYFGPIPSGWNTVNVDLYWSNESAGSGNVAWTAIADDDAVGTAIGGGSNVFVTDSAPAQAVLKKTTLVTGKAVTPGDLLNVLIARLGGAGADTLAGVASVLLVNVVKAS